ncbi:MAG: hypothetical protein LBG80_13470 [Bacteroidales bacterium]|jgi:hypothetical protein|nr:hypothetical protein [Bacteroidales bacterium]
MMEGKKKHTVELDYNQTEANVFHSRHWVMDTVKVNDNFAGDGSDVMMTMYECDYGYYDHNERAFYGFALVNEKLHNTQNANTVYRRYNRYYYNNNLYYKGLNLTEEVLSGGDLPYICTMNKYNHQTLTRNDIESMYVTMDTTVTCYFEGQHDKFGNKTLVEYGNNLTTAYSYNSQNLRLNGQSVINAGLSNPQVNYLNNVLHF